MVFGGLFVLVFWVVGLGDTLFVFCYLMCWGFVLDFWVCGWFWVVGGCFVLGFCVGLILGWVGGCFGGDLVWFGVV